uniref:Death-associated protein 1 n=1 Tax=Electrophorus electricus TaxID=8005 RepID=A0A4W4F3D9_ELEEL
MSSPPKEKIETRAGHPPAVKAGGMRIVQKHQPGEPASDRKEDKDSKEFESCRAIRTSPLLQHKWPTRNLSPPCRSCPHPTTSTSTSTSHASEPPPVPGTSASGAAGTTPTSPASAPKHHRPDQALRLPGDSWFQTFRTTPPACACDLYRP